MNYTILIIFLVLTSFLLSIILVNITKIIMAKYGVVDRPSIRRAHDRVTPRAGGLAFIFTFLLLLPLIEYFLFKNVNNSEKFLQIFAPLALVSFWDDVSGVPVLIRLVIHMLCSILAVMWLIHPHKILHSELSLVVDLAFGTFALMAFLNVYNFLDGIDGITVSQSIHLSLTILFLCFIKPDIIPNVWIIITMASIILGWSCGFILFNWQPASIFIGDVGSISLGFVIGICLLTIATASERLFAACAISSLYYIADGGVTLLVRLVNGEKIWQPHLQHFFQKAVRRGLSHKMVVSRIIFCNFILMLLSIGALFYPIMCIALGLLTVIVTIIRLIK